MRTRTKICGITRVEDADAAVAAGADAIGLVFYANSPRHVGVDRAAEIVASLPPFVAAVGLFVDAGPAKVRAVLAKVRLDLLQFHGDESPEYCQSFNLPYIKAVRVRPELNLVQYAADFASAGALLLDAWQEGVAGGTGQVFDWDLIPSNLPKPVILAGGLNANNVGAAIRRVRPYAVDVSGGVEREKGIKDADKIAAFMRGVLDAGV
ncbi:MAG TPA: phosphoribosylanthranilate isomerase [Methylophilaceae bacterium]|nr:phosphoribosylanthranilate isomerase [Methylophilaceae bacterium]HQR61348.1 phosphoribosylanthranilate isomerase [Methylophilaceae bacterium]